MEVDILYVLKILLVIILVWALIYYVFIKPNRVHKTVGGEDILLDSNEECGGVIDEIVGYDTIKETAAYIYRSIFKPRTIEAPEVVIFVPKDEKEQVTTIESEKFKQQMVNASKERTEIRNTISEINKGMDIINGNITKLNKEKDHYNKLIGWIQTNEDLTKYIDEEQEKTIKNDNYIETLKEIQKSRNNDTKDNNASEPTQQQNVLIEKYKAENAQIDVLIEKKNKELRGEQEQLNQLEGKLNEMINEQSFKGILYIMEGNVGIDENGAWKHAGKIYINRQNYTWMYFENVDAKTYTDMASGNFGKSEETSKDKDERSEEINEGVNENSNTETEDSNKKEDNRNDEIVAEDNGNNDKKDGIESQQSSGFGRGFGRGLSGLNPNDADKNTEKKKKDEEEEGSEEEEEYEEEDSDM